MTLTAGSIDVASLLATAKEPLTMIDAAMQDATEAQAQELAKAHTEVATARALVVVASECARWYKAYTDETKRSSAFIGEIADVLDAAEPPGPHLAEPNRLASAATALAKRVKDLEAEVARLAKLAPQGPPADRRSIQLH